MRLIGHLENPTAAATFSQYLHIQGIANELEKESGAWAIWVHSEDELDQAKSLLRRYLGNPEDPKFRVASLTRADLGESGLETEAGKPEKSVPQAGSAQPTPQPVVLRVGMGPLTLALIVACVAVAFASGFGEQIEFLAPMFIAPFADKGMMIEWRPGLTELSSGEVWRLWSPMLIHFGPLHLLMNMLWLSYLGSMIESRERTARLAWLVLVIGGISNLGQYLLSGPNFGGMSGVVYGLLGYIWMKCRYQPGSGYFLSLNTVTFMLVWFFVCLAGIIPGIANGAHTMGLLTGVAWGFLSAKLVARRVG